MSATTRTLRGVFQEPKMNHRRDFLRENKLNLRELQKNTTQKITQQKQELDRRQHKHLQRYRKLNEQNGMERLRSASHSRNGEHQDARQMRHIAGEKGGGDDAAATLGVGRPNHLSVRRSYSQQRDTRNKLQQTKSYEQLAGNSSTCNCSHPPTQRQHRHNHNHHHVEYRDHVPRSTSAISVISKAESCDKEIQTEDINDEDFLYEALKKCSSSEVHKLNKQTSLALGINTRDSSLTRSNGSLHTKQYDNALKSIKTREKDPYVYHDHYEESKSQHEQSSQYNSRTPRVTHQHNGYKHETDTHDNNVDEELDQHFQNLNINPNIMREQEQQSSARSRQTLCSTTSKKTNGSLYKLGSRDEIRLPRYLEKEKREKEEERIREMSKDPNCPMGYYALSEQERLQALQKAQKKMSSLINELNHMPMTTETLRLRHRKVEIEKELTQLELDIRTFSKPKVYLIEPPPIQY